MNKNYFSSVVPGKTIKIYCFLLVSFFSISFSTYGQENRIGPFVDQLTGTGNFKAAAGVTSLNVQAWGAGGGGGGSAGLLSLVELGQAGGGGGAFSSKNININPPTTVNPSFSYSVGVGGLGGSANGSVHGGDGIETIFNGNGNAILVPGGKGGKGSVLVTNTGAGPGAVVGSGGDFNYRGGDGGHTYLIQLSLIPLRTGINRSGGGGGSAGPNSDGNNALGSVGGIAVSGGGAGGAGAEKTGNILNAIVGLVLSDDIPGIPGGFPGGGGGGGVGNGLVNGVIGGLFNPVKSSNGGNGADGKITVGYTCPEYSITGFNKDASCTSASTILLTGNLPIGTYEISYKISLGSEVTVPMVVSVAGTGSITVNGLLTAGLSTVTITRIKSENCWTKVNFAIPFDRPVKPTLGIITPPICTVPTASVVLSGLSTLSAWTINATPNTTGLTGLTGTLGTTTISGLTPGITYNFSVSYGGCTSEALSVQINSLPTITWKNGSWDGALSIDKKAVFESNYDQNADVTACSCEVKSGADVVFKSGRYLKLRNELRVHDGGSLTFKNNASLVQMNDGFVNEGDITYERETEINRYDYTYWSSPVEGWTLKKLSPSTLFDRYFSYNPDNGGWVVSISGAAEMMPGHGYIVRGPQPYSITDATTFTGKFTGVPNNGVVDDIVMASSKDYLIGNPYPSAISADKFLALNAAVLQGTLYFWTHNAPPVAATGTTTYKYTTNDYASYNGTGGVNTKPAVGGEAPPTGEIAAGQGFFAPSSALGGTVVFNNDMRLSGNEIIDNSQFFKLDTGKNATTTTEKSRVWLNLTNKEGAFKQALIGYVTGATNEYDKGFDGITYNGNQYIDFYSVNNENNLTIQGRALPFVQKDSVALGYKSTISEEFQISIDQTDGVLASQSIFIEDKLTQVLHDLKTPYSFTTEIGTFNNRFVLRYEDKNAIIEDVDTLLTAVSVSTKDKSIKLKTTDSVIDKVYIYDFSGGLVYSDSEINATTTIISNLLVDHSALIVHVVLENGKKTVKKIMY